MDLQVEQWTYLPSMNSAWENRMLLKCHFTCHIGFQGTHGRRWRMPGMAITACRYVRRTSTSPLSSTPLGCGAIPVTSNTFIVRPLFQCHPCRIIEERAMSWRHNLFRWGHGNSLVENDQLLFQVWEPSIVLNPKNSSSPKKPSSLPGSMCPPVALQHCPGI